MKLFNRMMTAEFAYELLRNKEYLFLSAKNQKKNDIGVEKRGLRMGEMLNPLKHCEVEYICDGISREKKIIEKFKVSVSNNSAIEYSSLRKRDMYSFLEYAYSLSDVLVVDFTLMNTRFLGAFCAILNMFPWKEVYFCYTEPGKYNKNEYDNFDLKNVTMGFDQIPSLETFSDSSTECDWVVFLGFEGTRVLRLEEEASASRRYALPHISIPSMKTSWHNYAMNANRQFFELKIGNRETLGYVSAINPFETYHRLNFLRENNAGVRLVISPIGPKPVMLGCIMYVLENETEMLLFDNPFQEGSNTIDYGESHFYDLTQFVHSVKNKRYIEEEE